MINFLEAATSYNDSWNLTFYYVATLAFIIGIFWTYMQVFVKPKKNKKTKTKENTIYQNSEDTIEESYKDFKTKKKKTKKY